MDAPRTALDAQKTPGRFGKIPAWVGDPGVIGDLGCSEAKVYLALACQAQRLGFTARPTVSELMAMTRLSERTIQRATANLIEAGLITRTINRGRLTGKRYNSNEYELVQQKPQEVKPVTLDDGYRPDVNPSPRVAGIDGLNPSDSAGKPVTQGGTHLEPVGLEEEEEASSGADAEEGGAVRDNLAALSKVQVGEPKRTHLARLEGMTANLIRDVGNRGARNGILVNQLEAAAGEAANTRKQTEDRQRRQAAERANEQTSLEANDRRRAVAQEILDRHSEAERDAAFEEHLETISHPAARKNAVLENRTTFVARILVGDDAFEALVLEATPPYLRVAKEMVA